MERLLINMAIVKVNWDNSGSDLLENYIPLLGHVLWEYKEKTVSLQEIRTHFREVAEFEIPIAAIGALVKRATKKYGFLVRQQDGTFEISREKLPEQRYREKRDLELRKYHALRNSFVQFCTTNNVKPPSIEEIDTSFFNVLYDVAPSLVSSSGVQPPISGGQPSKEPESVRALVARFVVFSYENDPASFEAIESFVRGAMLTETFYYSAPDAITQKMRDVVVYFDTGFILRVLQLCEKGIAEPCIELTQILRRMNVKMRCYRDTYNEVHRILHAAASQLKSGRRLMPNHPGDVFDFYNSIGAKQSDVELDIAMLETSLKKLGVLIEERPLHVMELTIDEAKLSKYIDEVLPGQTDTARQHDIDCLTSIFRLRLGRVQPFLESCVAIFITTNVNLARASARFFNKEEGVSNAPVCMSDQVFTTLVWLKSVNKLPSLPKHLLVANCIAATQPSDKLWHEYITEANALHINKQISEEDYAVLVHSLEARHHLMDFIIESGEFIHGTVKDILGRARTTYTKEVFEQLQAVERSSRNQRQKLTSLIQSVSSFSLIIVRIILLVLWVALIGYGLFVSAPKPFTLSTVFDVDAWIFILVVVVGILNLVWGVRLIDFCNRISQDFGNKVEDILRRLLVA